MGRRLFNGSDREVSSRIADMVYCNPFEERRWKLEREILGDEYQERSRYLIFGESGDALAPNLGKMMDIGTEQLEKARSKIVSGEGGFSLNDLEVYQSLVHFVCYHEVMLNFDEVIEKMLAGNGVGKIPFFLKCRERLRYFLNVDPGLRISPEKEGLYFAFYFQLRRAWLTIFRFVVGRSEGIVGLRSRIWQSSFTKDMKRYQRSLYDRMGDVVTLITGPSGSGKELVARAVGLSRFVPFDHVKSEFAVDVGKVFFPINLSALSPTLIESEVFGHKKGAFTGALQDRRGYFEECGKFGTVFLDEIGETDPLIQVKLLRVLQTRRFQRLGDTTALPFVGKIMAATNRDLPKEIEEGRFREDFYFRLCADRIRTPGLRELISGSIEELECLVTYIANRVAGPLEGESLSEESCSWIRKRLGLEYSWPGNFRELEQCVRNVMISGEYSPEAIEHSNIRDLTKKSLSNKVSANQLMCQYAQLLYREFGSYEETAKVMEVDRRTAKRYVLGG